MMNNELLRLTVVVARLVLAVLALVAAGRLR